jgi:hypothetical protein
MTSLCLLAYTEMCHIAGTNKALTYVLNMELGKAYFSAELDISIIQAEEGCKWSRNCRPNDNRCTEEATV